MNVKHEFELIDKQLEEIYKWKNLVHAIDLFEKVQALNSKLGVEQSEVTAFNENGDPQIILTAQKDEQEINRHIGLVFKDYGIERVSSACFIETLVPQRCTTITIKNTMTLDEFTGKYLSQEYNSLYLYKKMLPQFEATEDKKDNKKKPKI